MQPSKIQEQLGDFALQFIPELDNSSKDLPHQATFPLLLFAQSIVHDVRFLLNPSLDLEVLSKEILNQYERKQEDLVKQQLPMVNFIVEIKKLITIELNTLHELQKNPNLTTAVIKNLASAISVLQTSLQMPEHLFIQYVTEEVESYQRYKQLENKDNTPLFSLRQQPSPRETTTEQHQTTTSIAKFSAARKRDSVP